MKDSGTRSASPDLQLWEGLTTLGYSPAITGLRLRTTIWGWKVWRVGYTQQPGLLTLNTKVYYLLPFPNLVNSSTIEFEGKSLHLSLGPHYIAQYWSKYFNKYVLRCNILNRGQKGTLYYTILQSKLLSFGESDQLNLRIIDFQYYGQITERELFIKVTFLKLYFPWGIFALVMLGLKLTAVGRLSGSVG